jgi:hypothetical protein
VCLSPCRPGDSTDLTKSVCQAPTLWSSTCVSTVDYPPSGIVRGGWWTKNTNYQDVFEGQDGVSWYGWYYYTVSGPTYGNGKYTAWSNSIYSYSDSSYDWGEWPPSGAFDKLAAQSYTQTGWLVSRTQSCQGTQLTGVLPYLALRLPYAIRLCSYSITLRTDCCAGQGPGGWVLEGSNDDGVTWFVLERQQDVTWTSIGQTQIFNNLGWVNSSVTDTDTFSNFRWTMTNFTSSNTDLYVSIGELRLYSSTLQTTSPTIQPTRVSLRLSR